MNILKFVKPFCLLFCLILSFGCSPLDMLGGNTATDLSKEKREQYWQGYEEDVFKEEEEAKKFLGKTKGTLESHYGKPDSVNYDVFKYNKIIKVSVKYEEEIVYTYEKGVLMINKNSYSIIFYLNDGIVKDCKVFGRPFN